MTGQGPPRLRPAHLQGLHPQLLPLLGKGRTSQMSSTRPERAQPELADTHWAAPVERGIEGLQMKEGLQMRDTDGDRMYEHRFMCRIGRAENVVLSVVVIAWKLHLAVLRLAGDSFGMYCTQ